MQTLKALCKKRMIQARPYPACSTTGQFFSPEEVSADDRESKLVLVCFAGAKWSTSLHCLCVPARTVAPPEGSASQAHGEIYFKLKPHQISVVSGSKQSQDGACRGTEQPCLRWPGHSSFHFKPTNACIEASWRNTSIFSEYKRDKNWRPNLKDLIVLHNWSPKPAPGRRLLAKDFHISRTYCGSLALLLYDLHFLHTAAGRQLDRRPLR